MPKIRLDKFISSQTVLSRKDARNAVAAGRVLVGGKPVRQPDYSVDTTSEIRLDGKPIVYKSHVYFMMNKPAGVVTATRDTAAKTVMDLLPGYCKKAECSPVGRLDRDTTGLLLITNDGDFLHHVISPNCKIEKSYLVTLDAEIPTGLEEAFVKGIRLADGTRCRPAVLERLGGYMARVVITEGKYHQVKRMFGTAGLGVKALHRERIGGLSLDPSLILGEIKELSFEKASSVFS